MVVHTNISRGSGIEFGKNTEPVKQLVYTGGIGPGLTLSLELTMPVLLHLSHQKHALQSNVYEKIIRMQLKGLEIHRI